MQDSNGINSLRQAREILEKYAPEGEHLAYINDEEAKYLRYMGGAGIPVNSSGIPSYFSLKKIFKPVAKVLNAVVPDFLKPALPFLAAAVPFLAPGLMAGIGSYLLPSSLTAAGGAAAAGGALSWLPGAVGGGVLNLGSQLSQKGAAERGINLTSLGLGSLSGALSTPGAVEAFKGAEIVGNAPTTALNPELAQFGNLATQNIPVTVADVTNFSNFPTTPDLSFAQKAQNLLTGAAESGAKVFEAGQQALEPGGAGVFSKEFITAAAPGQIGAAGDLAYNAAWQANQDFLKQQEALGQTVAQSKADQIAYIRSAMKTAGFQDDEIESALTRSGFAYGGYAGYAKGGLMNLGGMEMDYRAKGGFVPIGKKERADDVPARLSKNEFVFTAKAVRNAGKGDIRKGAKKMYQIMNQLEAMA